MVTGFRSEDYNEYVTVQVSLQSQDPLELSLLPPRHPVHCGTAGMRLKPQF